MKRWVTKFMAVACLGVVAPAVHASTLGLDTDPLGNRADAAVRYAFWDSFTQTQVNPPSGSTYTFSGVADAGSTLTGLSLTQNTAHALGVQGSGLLLPGGGPVSDVYYSSTFAQNWTLNAISSIDIDSISFQIKTANVNEAVMGQIYTPTLVGVGAASFHTGAQVVGEAPFFGNFANYVIEYRWTGLNITAGTPLAIQFSMAGGPSGNFTRKPLDFVSLDVTSVPEPSSMILLGVGAVTLFGLRRKLKG